MQIVVMAVSPMKSVVMAVRMYVIVTVLMYVIVAVGIYPLHVIVAVFQNNRAPEIYPYIHQNAPGSTFRNQVSSVE